ncbi:MAG: hypothetical protein C1O27_002511 [Chloroflexi bacterium]|jgi:hypothetical protein|nr:MAG: hypothetical protein C1O27_002511 [Chloroflexota bacterium]
MEGSLVISEMLEDGEPECMHFWMIEPPNGPESSGQCKNCGEWRSFRNSLPDSGWERGHGAPAQPVAAAPQAAATF